MDLFIPKELLDLSSYKSALGRSLKTNKAGRVYMKKLRRYILSGTAILAAVLLAACAGGNGSNGKSYYEDLNYVEIDSKTFRIGDTVDGLLKDHPDLETDDPDVLTAEGSDQYSGHYLDDSNGDTVLYVSVINKSGKESSSYAGYIDGYELDYSDGVSAGFTIYDVKRDVSFPPLITSILEEFKTQAEKDPSLAWKDYEAYKDKLIFIPYITRDDHSKEIYAKMIAYKDETMTEGVLYDIHFAGDELMSFNLTEDEYEWPWGGKDKSNSSDR